VEEASSSSSSSSSSSPPSSTKCSWARDLTNEIFLANSEESVRVMGVATAVAEHSMEFSMDHRSGGVVLSEPAKTEPRHRCGNDTDSNDGHRLVARGSPGRQFPLSGARDRSATNNERTKEIFFSVTIDDGTASVAFWAPQRMLLDNNGSPPWALAVEAGKTYDCLLRLGQTSGGKQWLATSLARIEDPIDEQYRWMELSHHDRSRSESSLRSSSPERFGYSNLCHRYGFPSRKRNAVEVYRLVCLHAKLQRDRHEEKTTTTTTTTTKKNRIAKRPNKILFKPGILRKKTTGRSIPPPPPQKRGLQRGSMNRNRNKIIADRKKQAKKTLSRSPASPPPTPVPVEGLLLKDLATVLQKPHRAVQEMTEDLQLEGKIYQNERGEYLPL